MIFNNLKIYFLLSLLCFQISSFAKTETETPKNTTVVQMDDMEVYSIQNPTYLKGMDKAKYKATDNNLVVDLTINLQDRGIHKDVARCVDGLIQESKKDSNLNTYSVEALALMCANYPRHISTSKDEYKKYFDGFQLHRGGKNGLLVLTKPENRDESIAALKGLPVEKLDLNMEKDEIGLKYCTSTSGYTSEACSKLDCDKKIGYFSDSVYKFTSCGNPSCKGFTGSFLKAQVFTPRTLMYNSLTLKKVEKNKSQNRESDLLSLFGTTYKNFKLDPDSLENEACIPCPARYHFNGSSCVDGSGCEVTEKFNGRYCVMQECPSAKITRNGECDEECDVCKDYADQLRKTLNSTEPVTLEALVSYATGVYGSEKIADWERSEPKKAAKLKSRLLTAAWIEVEKKEKNKTCNKATCLTNDTMLEAINQSDSFCKAGQMAGTYAVGDDACVDAKCWGCVKALDNLDIYQGTPASVIACGSQQDQTSIMQFLISNKRDEFQDRLAMCHAGRVGVCSEFQPITNNDVRVMAQRIGLNCGGSSSPRKSGGKQ